MRLHRGATGLLNFAGFDALIEQRRQEADAFYAVLQSEIVNPDMRLIQRQAFAGMLWSKQFYCFDVAEWLDGDPRQPPPPEQRKKVHVFASHSHLMAADIYNTPEHAGQVLPGWIVGTAGAEQYRENIQYGYLEVEVHPDGTLEPRFVEVGRDAPPLAAGPEAQSLTEFCFTVNKRPGGAASDRLETDCACGAVK